jgi:hypothetical protein
MSKRVFAVSLFLVIFVCVTTKLGRSQEVRATMVGRVTDLQGAAVPDAAVKVVSDETGVERQTHYQRAG